MPPRSSSPRVSRTAETFDEFATKHAAEDLDGKEEARILRPDPPLVIAREAARRYDAVDVRMPDEGLPPRVENAEEADRGAEVFRVGGDLEERGGARAKQEVIHQCGVAATQRMERVGQREDDVDVRHVQQLALAGGQPAVTGLRLTLRTVPVPTRVVRDGPMSAGAALIDMATERGGPTSRERAQHRALLHAEPGMSFEEAVTLRVEDIGHLHGGPAHDCGGFRSSRDRGITGGCATWSCSSGFGAAWRCRRDRWR